MTNSISAIIKADVLDKLATIPGVCVLPGYVQHHIRELLDDLQPRKFLPAVFAQPGPDRLTDSDAAPKSKLERDVLVVGLVSVRHPGSVSDQLDELAFQIRKALYVDPYEESAQAMAVRLGDAKYDLPESGDPYAFVEMTITLTYQENWR